MSKDSKGMYYEAEKSMSAKGVYSPDYSTGNGSLSALDSSEMGKNPYASGSRSPRTADRYSRGGRYLLFVILFLVGSITLGSFFSTWASGNNTSSDGAYAVAAGSTAVGSSEQKKQQSQTSQQNQKGQSAVKTTVCNEPVDLTSIEPYYEGYIQIEKRGMTDIFGNKYQSGIRGYMDSGDSNCYCIWDLGGKYRTLTATGFIRKSDKSSNFTGSYKIYGDGRLLYSRSDIGCLTRPYQISIDVSGVTDLKIEMYGGGNMGSHGINSALGNIMLYK